MTLARRFACQQRWFDNIPIALSAPDVDVVVPLLALPVLPVVPPASPEPDEPTGLGDG